RQEMENKGLVANLNRMPVIVAALIAHDDIEPLGEQIDDLAFSFIAPLGADDCYNHSSAAKRSAVRDQTNEFKISDSRFQDLKTQDSNFQIADTKQARLGSTKTSRAQ